MKTLQNSTPTLFCEMESSPSTSSRAVSRAKTFRSQGSKQDSKKEREAGCGQKSTDLLASYDPSSSSWRTSQTSLLDQLSGQAHGLAEFSATWPRSGTMRSGIAYPRQSLVRPIAESASGLLPTPRKAMHGKSYIRVPSHGNLEEVLGEIGLIGWIDPSFYERMMDYPATHTELAPAEIPLSHASQNSSDTVSQ